MRKHTDDNLDHLYWEGMYYASESEKQNNRTTKKSDGAIGIYLFLIFLFIMRIITALFG